MNEPVAPTRRDRLDQLIVNGEERISRLRFLIAEITERGQDASRAEALVRQFEDRVASWNEWRLWDRSSSRLRPVSYLGAGKHDVAIDHQSREYEA